jgi:hypothetical protein
VRESLVRDFFTGTAGPRELGTAADHFLAASPGPTIATPIFDLTSDFFVLPKHLLRVCNAALSGALKPEALQAIGLFLIASDRFRWSSDNQPGGAVARTVHEWAEPEMNEPLTLAYVSRCRTQLLTGYDEPDNL